MLNVRNWEYMETIVEWGVLTNYGLLIRELADIACCGVSHSSLWGWHARLRVCELEQEII
jgi:hypothetical protein